MEEGGRRSLHAGGTGGLAIRYSMLLDANGSDYCTLSFELYYYTSYLVLASSIVLSFF